MGVYLTLDGKAKIKEYIKEIEKLSSKYLDDRKKYFEPITEETVIKHIEKYDDDEGMLTIHGYHNKSLILKQCEDYRYKFDSCETCKYIKHCISCKACDNYGKKL